MGGFLRGETILQTHPDFRFVNAFQAFTYQYVGDPEHLWNFTARAHALLEAFRTPSTIGALKMKTNAQDFLALEKLCKDGMILVLDSVRHARKPSALTQSLFKVGTSAKPHARKPASAFITRTGMVDDLSFFVLDGVFKEKEISQIESCLVRHPHHLAHHAPEYPKKCRWWGTMLPLELPMYERITDCVKQLYPDMGLQLMRGFCNMNRYGDTLLDHADFDRPGVSAMYYANSEWDKTWQGETILYDKKMEAQCAIAPRPGRLVVFRGDMFHRGGVPSRLMFEPRVTVVLNYKVTKKI